MFHATKMAVNKNGVSGLGTNNIFDSETTVAIKSNGTC